MTEEESVRESVQECPQEPLGSHEPVTIEEQLNTETSKPTKLNKNGKPRKQLTPEALERLAKARQKANAIRKQQQVKKLEEKVEKLNTETQNILPKPTPVGGDFVTKPVSTPSEGVSTEGVQEGVQEEEEIEQKPVSTPKPKGKKKTKIIVEQSSDDSDEFEPNDNVVFVKRVSRKKKQVEPNGSHEPPPTPPPPTPEMPPTQLTPQQRLLKSQYESMFSGGFMNQSNMMRKYY